MKKAVIYLTALALALTAVLSACGQNTANQQTPADTNQQTETETQKPENTEKPAETPKSDPVLKETKTEVITFVGKADSNSIEVSFDSGEFGTMQLSDSAKAAFDAGKIAEGDKITVEYSEENSQKTVIRVVK